MEHCEQRTPRNMSTTTPTGNSFDFVRWIHTPLLATDCPLTIAPAAQDMPLLPAKAIVADSWQIPSLPLTDKARATYPVVLMAATDESLAQSLTEHDDQGARHAADASADVLTDLDARHAAGSSTLVLTDLDARRADGASSVVGAAVHDLEARYATEDERVHDQDGQGRRFVSFAPVVVYLDDSPLGLVVARALAEGVEEAAAVPIDPYHEVDPYHAVDPYCNIDPYHGVGTQHEVEPYHVIDTNSHALRRQLACQVMAALAAPTCDGRIRGVDLVVLFRLAGVILQSGWFEEDYEDQEFDEHGLAETDGPLDPAVDLDCSAFLEIIDDQPDSEELPGPLFVSDGVLTRLLLMLRSIADDASGPAAGDAVCCTGRTAGLEGAFAFPVVGCRCLAAVSATSHAGRRAALFLDRWLDDSVSHQGGCSPNSLVQKSALGRAKESVAVGREDTYNCGNCGLCATIKPDDMRRCRDCGFHIGSNHFCSNLCGPRCSLSAAQVATSGTEMTELPTSDNGAAFHTLDAGYATDDDHDHARYDHDSDYSCDHSTVACRAVGRLLSRQLA